MSKSKKSNASRRNVSASATRYPLERYQMDKADCVLQENTYMLFGAVDSAVTSDGSGIIANVFSNDPSQIVNWSSYASCFEEVRVLNMRVTYSPLWSTGGSTATYWAPIGSVIDRSDATALTGYSLVARSSSGKEHAGERGFSIDCPLSGIEDSSFQKTSSVSANNWIKFYSTGNSPSLTVGRVLVELLLQFRGQGIN